MAYEKFKRTAVRIESPALSLVPDGRIVLNAAAGRILIEARVKTVVLLWDEPTHRMALKATSKGDRDGYAVSMGDHSASVRAKSFITHIGWNAPRRETMPATWNQSEKMLEAMLPPGFLKARPDSKGKAKARAVT